MKSVLKNAFLVGTGFVFGYVSKNLNKKKIVREDNVEAHNYQDHLENFGNLKPFGLIHNAYDGMRATGYESFFLKVQDQLEGFSYLEYFAPSESLSYIISDSKLLHEEIKEICKLGCVFEVTDNLQGHKGVAHGGLICTLFDTNLSYLTIMSTQLKPSMTAYLNVSYKKPLKTKTKYLMIMELDKIEGRKVFLKGKILNEKAETISEAEALFIVLKDPMAISPFLSAVRSVATVRDTIDHYIKKPSNQFQIHQIQHKKDEEKVKEKETKREK